MHHFIHSLKSLFFYITEGLLKAAQSDLPFIGNYNAKNPQILPAAARLHVSHQDENVIADIQIHEHPEVAVSLSLCRNADSLPAG